MTPYRPYLIRALNDWILDNDCTPYLLVSASGKDVRVPQDFVKDGQIILNISPLAVRGLLFDNEAIEFEGRFGGVPNRVFVPVASVLGIYAKENGQGMFFDAGEPEPPADPPGGESKTSAGRKKGKTARPALRVVK